MRRRDLNCVGISWKVKKVARKAVFLTEYFELFVGLIGYANAKKMSKKKRCSNPREKIDEEKS